MMTFNLPEQESYLWEYLTTRSQYLTPIKKKKKNNLNFFFALQDGGHVQCRNSVHKMSTAFQAIATHIIYSCNNGWLKNNHTEWDRKKSDKNCFTVWTQRCDYWFLNWCREKKKCVLFGCYKSCEQFTEVKCQNYVSRTSFASWYSHWQVSLLEDMSVEIVLYTEEEDNSNLQLTLACRTIANICPSQTSVCYNNTPTPLGLHGPCPLLYSMSMEIIPQSPAAKYVSKTAVSSLPVDRQ